MSPAGADCYSANPLRFSLIYNSQILYRNRPFLGTVLTVQPPFYRPSRVSGNPEMPD